METSKSQNVKTSKPEAAVAAVLTADAAGAIAVIGLGGSGVGQILGRVLRRRCGDGAPLVAIRTPVLCRIVGTPGAIDDVVVTLIRDGPDGYAEICTHGGVAVVREVESLLAAEGVRIVGPEELPHPLRAVDPVQREVDAALTRAGSRRLADWLLEQREILPAALADAERMTDAERAAFNSRSRAAIRLVQGNSIAIVGPPNAGKSTLANRLIGSDRVITSNVPGTTRDWVSERAQIRGWPVTLTDTAGVRQTTCEIESEAIRRGMEQVRRADLALLVLDGSTDATSRREVLAGLSASLPDDLPRIVVINKSDLARPADLEGSSTYHVSALTGAGIDVMEAAIEAALGLDELRPGAPAAISDGQLGVMVDSSRQGERR